MLIRNIVTHADVTQQLSENIVLMRDALDEVFAAFAEGEIC